MNFNGMFDNDVVEEEDIEAGNNLTADIPVPTPIPKAAAIPGGRVNGAKAWKPDENLFLIQQVDSRSLSNEVTEKDDRWTKTSEACKNKFGGLSRTNNALKEHFKGRHLFSMQ